MSVSITVSGKDVLAWITVTGILVLRVQGVDSILEYILIGILGAYYGLSYLRPPSPPSPPAERGSGG